MIPHANITAWRVNAPWTTDAQVEQDLVIARALVEIFSVPLLANSLAFRGGTALHKLFLRPAARYSEDIDLVQVRAEPIGPVIDALRGTLNRWLRKPQWKQGEGRLTLIYRFDSEELPTKPMRLKIEINTREHFAVHGYHRHRVQVENPWFTGNVDVVTFLLEELLATKLRALYQRKKGRDLFDIVRALERRPTIDRGQLVACFLEYMKHGGTPVSRAEFEANLAEKESDRAFLSDVHALLATAPDGAFDADFAYDANLAFDQTAPPSYDVKAAFVTIRRELIKLLPGDPWKGSR